MEEVNKELRAQGVLVVGAGTGDAWRVDGIRYDKRLTFRVPNATDAFRDAVGVDAFPMTLFIDRKGRIAERLHGGANADYFRKRVQYLLSEPLDDALADGPVTTEKPSSPELVPSLIYKVVNIFE